MKKITIVVDGIPDDLWETGWKAAIENSPIKILSDIRTDTFHFKVADMENALASPLCEMLILAQTMHAIIAYQKQNN